MLSILRRSLAGLATTTLLASAAWAQTDGVWIQIEARNSLTGATQRAADYAGELPDVQGYALPGGWYGIALGPYDEADAQAALRLLRASRAIPSDSFIADGSNFRDQFWPNGATAPVVETVVIDPEAPIAQEVIIEEPVIQPSDETVQEARASEAALSRPEREELQIALQWAGFYASTIDGAFGRGTRGAMLEWQAANNFEPTGVLTTSQRAELLRQYNAVLEGMDLRLVRDTIAGIEMEIPLGVVGFDAYAPPFARYLPTGEVEATVLLISQPGSQDRLFGLYEIMQTLEIIPSEGPRERGNRSFTIEGLNDSLHSYTFVTLDNDQIKGFTLVWPAGDEVRRGRVLDEMRASFTRIDGVLDPAMASPGEEQAVDLVSGLAIRQPVSTQSGIYIDGSGTVITSLDAVGECNQVIIDSAHEAQVTFSDAALGIAVLQPISAVAPIQTATFQSAVPRLQSDVAVAGYPYGNLISSPSLVFGTLADIRGLNGEEDIKRLSVTTQQGDAGGPVFDASGAVIGMLLPASDTGPTLPADVAFSLDAPAIMAALDGAGIAYNTTDTAPLMTRERLTRQAYNVTALVACWE